MFFETDSLLGDIILMYLPSSLFQSVLDILRNESPVYIYWPKIGISFYIKWTYVKYRTLDSQILTTLLKVKTPQI